MRKFLLFLLSTIFRPIENKPPDASLLNTGILSILKPDAMATEGYSFQDDEKTIIYIDIDMDIVVEKEKNERPGSIFSKIFFF